MAFKPILSSDPRIQAALKAIGVATSRSSRVIIDIQAGQPIRVYDEFLADESILNVLFAIPAQEEKPLEELSRGVESTLRAAQRQYERVNADSQRLRFPVQHGREHVELGR